MREHCLGHGEVDKLKLLQKQKQRNKDLCQSQTRRSSVGLNVRMTGVLEAVPEPPAIIETTEQTVFSDRLVQGSAHIQLA